MVEESKYCSDVLKNHFNKELVMIKKDVVKFENSTKYWNCDNVYVDRDVKARDYFHITRTYRDSAHRDCNIKVKLNHKFLSYFTT